MNNECRFWRTFIQSQAISPLQRFIQVANSSLHFIPTFFLHSFFILNSSLFFLLSVSFNDLFSLSYLCFSFSLSFHYYFYNHPPNSDLPHILLFIIPLFSSLSGCTKGFKQRCCASHYARQQTLTHCQRML